eukprot:CAMPEP_0179241866 /NCGR_PEP_ID=MMETSP0797-20121207/16717_1 /TAXON_ID=47934 /ORGANISM="Dinophysis acuminata, Strain DAEP01" /LENGTH=182 /DNA_ID=CAMNT_0020949273 /DNA_START=136 /DNA_END=683 /DNA_ORIENTATION=-
MTCVVVPAVAGAYDLHVVAGVAERLDDELVGAALARALGEVAHQPAQEAVHVVREGDARAQLAPGGRTDHLAEDEPLQECPDAGLQQLPHDSLAGRDQSPQRRRRQHGSPRDHAAQERVDQPLHAGGQRNSRRRVPPAKGLMTHALAAKVLNAQEPPVDKLAANPSDASSTWSNLAAVRCSA